MLIIKTYNNKVLSHIKVQLNIKRLVLINLYKMFFLKNNSKIEKLKIIEENWKIEQKGVLV